MDKSVVTFTHLIPVIIGIFGFMGFFLRVILKGQTSIKEEAKKGRKALHEKMDNIDTDVNKLALRVRDIEIERRAEEKYSAKLKEDARTNNNRRGG